MKNNKYSLQGIYKKVLVTGGAGFVGSNLVAPLLEDGLEVISPDDYSAGSKKNLKDIKKKYTNKFKQVDCDITNKKKTALYFKGVDVVFHQACSKMTIFIIKPKRHLEVNATGTFNLLELSKQYGVKKLSTGVKLI